MKKIITYSDGGARGNPGPAAYGAVIYEEKTNGNKIKIKEINKYIGETTNNQAEYKGVIAALEEAVRKKAGSVTCYLDSDLIVNQLQLKYKVKNKDLVPLFIKAWNLLNKIKEKKVIHIPREENKEADALVNKALDEKLK